MSHSQQTRRARALAVLAVGALAGAGLSGCGSGADELVQSSKRVNIERFREAVKPIGDNGTRCPLPFDVAAASARAHIEGAVRPGEPAASGAEGWSDDDAAARDPYSNLTPIQRVNGVEVTCSYVVGTAEIDVDTWTSLRGHPLNAALPLIQRNAGVASSAVGPFAEKMATIAPLRVVPVGDGQVAAIRLNVDGPGEAALFVSAKTLTPTQVTDLTTALATQLD
ncbi:hypothetical protein [Embleya sp. NBC_00896]|uniref:hypothetical protein n=1 Tax=Embleya sp. NBC_00896 TaxID=2975961 RepID=UPI00386E925E|nr:hypothetical protein OG928_05995 [Embleya sp. NBC_00896]